MENVAKNEKGKKIYYWLLLTGLFVFSLVAGLFGFKNYFLNHGEQFDWLRALYRTIQLFTFEGGDLENPIPIGIHIARFSAPVTTVMAFIMALLEIFGERWNNMRIAMMRRHTVIIGFGTKGLNILKSTKGKSVVVEYDPENPNLASVKVPSRIIIGDASNEKILSKARIERQNLSFF